MNDLKSFWVQFNCENNSWKKYFYALTTVYVLGILSIIRANYNYMDDFGRVLFGYRGWDDFSRYISYYGSVILHADGILNDISPFPQLLAAVIMGLAGAILICVFSQDKAFSWVKVAAVVPLGVSPYFLECFSFKFDAPYMAVSVLASVAPLLFINCDKRLSMLAVFLGTLIMCMTYQASSGIYVLCLFFFIASSWNNGMPIKECMIKMSYPLAAFVVAMLFYRIALMKVVEDYASSNVLGYRSIVITIIDNIKTYFAYLKGDSTDIWLIICGTLCLCFIRSFVMGSRKNKLQAFIVVVILVVFCSTISYGAYVILQKPLFYPRAMYGIGAFFSVLALLSLKSNEVNYLSKLVCVALAWSIFTFSLAYGNCLAEQRRYDNFRAQILLNDLSKLPNMDDKHVRKMQLQGTIGYSPAVKRVSERYRILNRLVHESVSSGFCFGEFYVFKYFNLPGIKQVVSWGENQTTLYEKDLPVFIDTAYHTIKADDRTIIVRLKETKEY